MKEWNERKILPIYSLPYILLSLSVVYLLAVSASSSRIVFSFFKVSLDPLIFHSSLDLITVSICWFARSIKHALSITLKLFVSLFYATSIGAGLIDLNESLISQSLDVRSIDFVDSYRLNRSVAINFVFSCLVKLSSLNWFRYWFVYRCVI